ncbi:MAG: peroxiredoxin family protein [Gemmatimonadota bacterium]
MHPLRLPARARVLGTLVAVAASPLAAQPRVGAPAPDFAIATVTAGDATPRTLTLSGLRGRIVVLAFFPKARTSGCTAQMKAYRDQYGALFGTDSLVQVIGISTDDPRTLAAWATELGTPVTFGADTTDAVGKLYAAKMPILPIHKRHLIVVGKDGRIAWEARPFRELSQPEYDSLAAAVRRARSAS